jgi:hypothetical protein
MTKKQILKEFNILDSKLNYTKNRYAIYKKRLYKITKNYGSNYKYKLMPTKDINVIMQIRKHNNKMRTIGALDKVIEWEE